MVIEFTNTLCEILCSQLRHQMCRVQKLSCPKFINIRVYKEHIFKYLGFVNYLIRRLMDRQSSVFKIKSFFDTANYLVDIFSEHFEVIISKRVVFV